MKQAYRAPRTDFHRFESETQILAGSGDPEGEQTEEFGAKEHTFRSSDSYPKYDSWITWDK